MLWRFGSIEDFLVADYLMDKKIYNWMVKILNVA